jgi:very-short-patch-repair endonuclease
MSDYKKNKKVQSILRKTKKKLRHSPIKKVRYLHAQSYKMSKNKTWPEKEFESILKELNIKFETQKILQGKIFDYYIPSTNTICEVDGDYWHGNKEKYDTLNEMQKRNIKNDKRKSIIARGLGYNLFRVWESELKENRQGVIDRVKREIVNN